MSRREAFGFDNVKALNLVIDYTSDGTTNEQQMYNGGVGYANGASSSFFLEPEHHRTNFPDQMPMDDYTRLIVFARRSGGSGNSWPGRIEFTRDTISSSGVSIPFSVRHAGQIGTFDITNNPLPFDFARKADLVGHAMDDALRCSVHVTPDSGAQSINMFFLLVPGFVDGLSNKGAVLSARRFLGGGSA